MDYRTFDAYVDAHASEFLDQLIELCCVPSVAAEGGPAMARAVELVLALCQRAGVAAELIPTEGGPPMLAADLTTCR